MQCLVTVDSPSTGNDVKLYTTSLLNSASHDPKFFSPICEAFFFLCFLFLRLKSGSFVAVSVTVPIASITQVHLYISIKC